jgi:hypothetical protein
VVPHHCVKFLANLSQASSTLRNVTLAQILSLHQKILHNDGVDTPGPLYLLLGTRVNFSRRFSNLVKGASQGKGLSELVMREENSESLDDADEKEIATNGVEPSLRIHKTQDVEDEDESTRDIENLQTSKSPPTSHQVDSAVGFEEEYQPAEGDEEFEEDPQGQDAENEADYLEDHEEQHISQGEGEYREVYGIEGEIQPHGQISAPMDHTPKSEFADDDDFKSPNGSQQSIKHTDTAKPLPNPETVSGEDNEEEDLIDYSDEEIQFPDEPVRHRTAAVVSADRKDNGTDPTFIPPCYRPEMCFCPQCSLLILAEYQAKDEELRSRSISRQAEEKLLEQSIDQSFNNTNDAEEEFAEGTETGNDQYHTEFARKAQSDNYEFAEPTGETNLGGQEDDQIGLSNDLEAFEDDQETYIYDTEGGHDVDGIPRANNLDEEAKLQGIPPYTEAIQAEGSGFEDINVMKAGHERPAPSTASSLGAAETAESSVTLGADEIQYGDDELDEEISQEQEANAATGSGHGSVLEQKDEIDYEDDEDEEIPISISSGATIATKVLPNSNGKRPIAEVESVLSTPTKGESGPRIIRRRLY